MFPWIARLEGRPALDSPRRRPCQLAFRLNGTRSRQANAVERLRGTFTLLNQKPHGDHARPSKSAPAMEDGPAALREDAMQAPAQARPACVATRIRAVIVTDGKMSPGDTARLKKRADVATATSVHFGLFRHGNHDAWLPSQDCLQIGLQIASRTGQSAEADPSAVRRPYRCD